MNKYDIPSRDRAIDVLRIISILAVIAIHTTSRSFELVQLDIIHYPLLFAVNQLARFAVPLFFFISGFVLEYRYDKPIILKQFYLRRLKRIVIPYLVWSAIYLLTSQHSFNWKTYFLDILTGSAANHLYFIPAILFFYLCFPLIHANSSKIFIKRTMINLLIGDILLLILNYYFNAFASLPTVLQAIIMNIYIFILGMYISKRRIQLINFIQKYFKFFVGLSIASGIFLLVSTAYTYLQKHSITILYDQWRPSITIFTMVAGLTLWFVLQNKIKKYTSWISSISSLTFFAFFYHLLVFNWFWQWYGSDMFERIAKSAFQTYALNVLVYIVLCLFVFFVGFLLHYIPFLNNLLGIEPISS